MLGLWSVGEETGERSEVGGDVKLELSWQLSWRLMEVWRRASATLYPTAHIAEDCFGVVPNFDREDQYKRCL